MVGAYARKAGSRKAILALLIPLTTGCVSAPPIDPISPLIAPGHVLALPRPADLGRSVEAAQLVTVHRDGKSVAFEGRMSVTPERFRLVGVDGMGRRAFTISWDKTGGITAESAEWLPEAIAPGPMLADLVVLYWPEAAVRAALAPAEATLVARDGGRSVMINGIETFRADYGAAGAPSWSGKLRYRNDAWGYEIEVQSVDLGP